MSNKKESVRPMRNLKILNDAEKDKSPKKRALTIVPSEPNTKLQNETSNNKNSPKKKKQMEHYMLQTIKNDSATDGDVSESIAFILRDDDDIEINKDISLPSTQVIEETITEDEDAAEDADTKTEEIVEHVCGKCYKSFRRFNGLKKHLDFCRFDSGYHLRKAEMLKNLEKIEKDAVIMENKDICFCCAESYDTFHLGHINCPDCPKSFKTQGSYERHIFITHSENNDYPCSVCNAKLRSAALLKVHEEQHQNRGKPFACKICGKDFTRSYHLKRHQKYSSCSANEQDSMNCKVCNKVFYRLDNLRAHLKQHLGTHVTKKPEYMCPICKNCFYSLSTLNIHTRTHTGERPFDCDLCEKNFPSLVALKKHRRYHTGEKPYICSVCSAAFAVKEVLNRHMKRHTGERPHVCNECGKSFIQATQLRNHVKTHVRPFDCSVCKEKFKTSKQLDRHSKIHNSKRVLKPRCKICNKTFLSAFELKKHNDENVHTNKRIREKERTDCAICEKNFDTAKNLHFHILKVHEVDPEQFVNEKPSKDNENTTPVAKKMKKSTSPSKSESSIHTDSESNTDDEVVQEVILDEVATPTNTDYTVIPLDSDNIIESVTTHKATTSPDERVRNRKGLAASLAAAISDKHQKIEKEETDPLEGEIEAEDLKLKENVRKLLDMLVDKVTLKKFQWPDASEEEVLCKVIENCGHDLSKDSENYKEWDYGSRMREYVKLLFSVVIHNDSIKELLNNYPIDEVIEYVLGTDEDDDDDGEDDDEEMNEQEEKIPTDDTKP